MIPFVYFSNLATICFLVTVFLSNIVSTFSWKILARFWVYARISKDFFSKNPNKEHTLQYKSIVVYNFLATLPFGIFEEPKLVDEVGPDELWLRAHRGDDDHLPFLKQTNQTSE